MGKRFLGRTKYGSKKEVTPLEVDVLMDAGSSRRKRI